MIDRETDNKQIQYGSGVKAPIYSLELVISSSSIKGKYVMKSNPVTGESIKDTEFRHVEGLLSKHGKTWDDVENYYYVWGHPHPHAVINRLGYEVHVECN